MKKLVFLFLLLSASPSVKSDILHSVTSSVKLQVDVAASAAKALPTSYSVSGTNITPTYDSTANAIGGFNLGSITSGVPAALETTFAVATPGDSFSLSESWQSGDATPSATSLTNQAVSSLPMLGETTTTAGGSAGSLAGSIASDHAITNLTPGNAGTSVTGQVITSIQID